jgi:DNA-binding response OmpR family regulator
VINAVKNHVTMTIQNTIVGFEKVTLQPISLMLLDFQMPLKNGIEVVKEVRDFYDRMNLQESSNQIELQ